MRLNQSFFGHLAAKVITYCHLRNYSDKDRWIRCLTTTPQESQIIRCGKKSERVELFPLERSRYRVSIEFSLYPYLEVTSVDFIVAEELSRQVVTCRLDYDQGLSYLCPFQSSITILDTNLIQLLEHLRVNH
jgi:hypothetical protein